MPNITGMRNLITFTLQNTLISAIPGKPFVNNNKQVNIDLSMNKLVHPPDLDGTRSTLGRLYMHSNQLTYLPHNYFDGCTKLSVVFLNRNLIT